MSDQILFGIAGCLATVWLVVHLILGGKEVVVPMRADRHLDAVVRDTLYVGWHYISVSLAAMAALFAIAIFAARADLAIAGTVLAWGFTLVGIGQVPAIGASYRDLPQGWLFLPIALLGTVALLF